jgi:general secretion pathway protein B
MSAPPPAPAVSEAVVPAVQVTPVPTAETPRESVPPPASSVVAPPVPAAVDASPPPPAPQEAPPADTPPADGRIVDFEALPQDVRASFGKLSVSGHIWSEEPGLRMLTVSDRIVREGQEAAPGVRLEEITQDGAVFTARGWRFRLADR